MKNKVSLHWNWNQSSPIFYHNTHLNTLNLCARVLDIFILWIWYTLLYIYHNNESINIWQVCLVKILFSFYIYTLFLRIIVTNILETLVKKLKEKNLTLKKALSTFFKSCLYKF
jgi:hypothetical protein